MTQQEKKSAMKPTRKPLLFTAATLALITAAGGAATLRRPMKEGGGGASPSVAAEAGAAATRADRRGSPPAFVPPPAHQEAEAPSLFGGPAVDREQLQTARRLRAEHLSQRFDELIKKEPPDEPYQSALEAQVRTMTALPALKGSRLEQLTCGTTLCRANVAFDNQEAQQRVQPVLQGAGRLTGSGDAFVRAIEDPVTPRALVYFARDRPLPYEEALGAPL